MIYTKKMSIKTQRRFRTRLRVKLILKREFGGLKIFY